MDIEEDDIYEAVAGESSTKHVIYFFGFGLSRGLSPVWVLPLLC